MTTRDFFINRKSSMATAIKETPTLTGKNAELFLEKIEKEKNNKIEKDKYKKSIELYKKILKKNPDIK